MKSFSLFSVILCFGVSPHAEGTDVATFANKPSLIALQIATADYATISGIPTKDGLSWKRTIIVKDHAWIREIAKELYDASYQQRLGTIMDMTTTVTFFDGRGKELRELEVFPPVRVKLDVLDYRLGGTTADTLGKMIENQEANQSPEPTSTSVTSPAGQEPRQP